MFYYIVFCAVVDFTIALHLKWTSITVRNIWPMHKRPQHEHNIRSGHSHGFMRIILTSYHFLWYLRKYQCQKSWFICWKVWNFLPSQQVDRMRPILSTVWKIVTYGWPKKVDPSMKMYQSRKLKLRVQEGCLWWGSRVTSPMPGRGQILALLHDGHPGISKMKALACGYVWWPNIDADLESQLNNATSVS